MAGSNSVTVRLGGSLAEIAGCALCEVALDEGVTLAEIAARVGISPNLVMLYSVSGRLRPANHAPEPGDEVLLIPAVAGG